MRACNSAGCGNETAQFATLDYDGSEWAQQGSSLRQDHGWCSQGRWAVIGSGSHGHMSRDRPRAHGAAMHKAEGIIIAAAAKRTTRGTEKEGPGCQV